MPKFLKKRYQPKTTKKCKRREKEKRQERIQRQRILGSTFIHSLIKPKLLKRLKGLQQKIVKTDKLRMIFGWHSEVPIFNIAILTSGRDVKFHANFQVQMTHII